LYRNEKTDFSEPDLSLRLLKPNGRQLDLVLTGKESEKGREGVVEIEGVLKIWKVAKNVLHYINHKIMNCTSLRLISIHYSIVFLSIDLRKTAEAAKC
jgi:hypothetical protein